MNVSSPKNLPRYLLNSVTTSLRERKLSFIRFSKIPLSPPNLGTSVLGILKTILQMGQTKDWQTLACGPNLACCKQNLIGTQPCTYIYLPWLLHNNVELSGCNRDLRVSKAPNIYYLDLDRKHLPVLGLIRKLGS